MENTKINNNIAMMTPVAANKTSMTKAFKSPAPANNMDYKQMYFTLKNESEQKIFDLNMKLTKLTQEIQELKESSSNSSSTIDGVSKKRKLSTAEDKNANNDDTISGRRPKRAVRKWKSNQEDLLEKVHSVKEKYEKYPLHEAAEGGEVEDLKILLTAGYYVDERDDDGMTAINYGAMWNHRDVIEVLHLAGASLDAIDNDGDTATIQAAYNKSPDALEYLLKNSADVNITNKDGITALEYTKLKKYPICENIILGHLQRIACSSQEEGRTPNTSSRMLSTDGTIVKAVKQEYGAFALHKACGAGIENEVKILLKHATKEDVEERNGFGWSPLYYASSRNHPNIIKLLIDAGADVNGTMEHNGDTPVIVASENDSAEALEYLIKQGADITKTNDHGDTAIFCASRYNTKDTVAIVKMLHENGCDINKCNNDGWNPVMWASKHGNYKILGYLLQHDECEFEKKNNNNQNAFDLATEGSHTRCLNLLNLYKNEKSGNNNSRKRGGGGGGNSRSRRRR